MKHDRLAYINNAENNVCVACLTQHCDDIRGLGRNRYILPRKFFDFSTPPRSRSGEPPRRTKTQLLGCSHLPCAASTAAQRTPPALPRAQRSKTERVVQHAQDKVGQEGEGDEQKDEQPDERGTEYGREGAVQRHRARQAVPGQSIIDINLIDFWIEFTIQ